MNICIGPGIYMAWFLLFGPLSGHFTHARPVPERQEQDESYLRELARIMGTECPIMDCENYEDSLLCPESKRILTYVTHLGFRCPSCRDCAPNWDKPEITTTDNNTHKVNPAQNLSHIEPTGAAAQNLSHNGTNTPAEKRSDTGNSTEPEIVESMDLLIEEIIEDTDNTTGNNITETDLDILKSIPAFGTDLLSQETENSLNNPNVGGTSGKNHRREQSGSDNATQKPVSPRPFVYEQEQGAILLEGDPRVLSGIVRFLRSVIGPHINLRVLANVN